LAFQAWLAIPSASRDPRSQRELAAQLEVHEVTLSDWKRLPGWAEAVYGLALSRVVGDLVPVLHAQVAAAKKGSLPHAQWLFELCGKWTPKAHVDHAVAANVRIVIETVDDRA
jgi:tetrahydromethanopterin S-methyltransferase subunit C